MNLALFLILKLYYIWNGIYLYTLFSSIDYVSKKNYIFEFKRVLGFWCLYSSSSIKIEYIPYLKIYLLHNIAILHT